MTTATDQYAEFRAISDRLWQVPTGSPGHHRFLFVVRSWWQDPKHAVLIVQAINTFRRAEAIPEAVHGDYALYIGTPPDDLFGEGGPYQRAQWVVEHGSKLSANEQSGFGFLTTAPDGIDLDWRP